MSGGVEYARNTERGPGEPFPRSWGRPPSDETERSLWLRDRVKAHEAAQARARLLAIRAKAAR